MRRLIERVGPFKMEYTSSLSPFQVLMNSVISQQLSRNSAWSIMQKVSRLIPEKDMPEAQDIAIMDPKLLRSAGVSRPKASTIIALARAEIEGTLPTREELLSQNPETIKKELCAFKGIGPWTVEMLLIFYLALPDILPATDYGIRKGFHIAYELSELPSAKAVLSYGKIWQPYRSVASWYLWRANDL